MQSVFNLLMVFFTIALLGALVFVFKVCTKLNYLTKFLYTVFIYLAQKPLNEVYVDLMLYYYTIKFYTSLACSFTCVQLVLEQQQDL